jgi:hypothetical protein
MIKQYTWDLKEKMAARYLLKEVDVVSPLRGQLARDPSFLMQVGVMPLLSSTLDSRIWIQFLSAMLASGAMSE